MEMLEHSAHKLTNLMLELNERYAGRKKPAPLNVVTEDSDMHMFNVDGIDEMKIFWLIFGLKPSQWKFNENDEGNVGKLISNTVFS